MAKASIKVVEVERVVKESKEVVVVEMSKKEAAYVLAAISDIHNDPWGIKNPPIYDALINLFYDKPSRLSSLDSSGYNYLSISQECRDWVESQPE